MTDTCHICATDLADAPVVGEYARHGHASRRVACVLCGLVQVCPQPDAAELAAYYADGYRREYTPLPVHAYGETIEPDDPRYEPALETGALSYAAMVARHATGRDVLEIGAGEGRLTRALTERGFRVTAVEPDPQCAAQVRERAPTATVLNAPLELAALVGCAFGAVVMQHSLEHIASPRAALRTVLSRMRRTAALIVEVPNVLHPYGQIDTWYWQHVHLFDFSPSTLAALLASCGFVIEDLRADGAVIIAVARIGHMDVPEPKRGGHWVAGYLDRCRVERGM